MKIYTSYYYQIRNFPKNLVALSTAAFPPKYIILGGKDNRGVICLNCPPFVPGKQCVGLCNGHCDPPRPATCKFLNTYSQQLMRIDFLYVQHKLQMLAAAIKEGEGLDDVDFAFIVYEAPSKLCSERYPIQKYFKSHGVEIEEWYPSNN